MRWKDEDWQRAFGSSVRISRTLREMTRKELAAMAGVDERYLGSVERGIANPSLKIIVAIAQSLGVEPSVLVQSPSSQAPHGKTS